MILHKTFNLDVKEDDAGQVALYASVFNNIDRQGEAIAPGAFANIDKFVKDGWLALNHDWDCLPIATIDSAMQDEKGLKLLCTWHSTEEAQACRTVVKERLARGKAVKCSIGYRVLEDAIETRNGESTRILKAIEIYEASIVNLPANPLAEVTAAKGWYEKACEQLASKEGRVISNTNRTRLMRMCERLREAATDLEALLTETEPAAPEDQPKSVDQLEVIRELSRFEALIARPLLIER